MLCRPLLVVLSLSQNYSFYQVNSVYFPFDLQVTFPKVKAKLILENVKRNIQQFTQAGFAP